MQTFQIMTMCGVMTRIEASNSYQATNIARDEGWVVVAVWRII